MKSTVVFDKYVVLPFITLLLASSGCATQLRQQPTTVGPHCNIAWDKTNDPKITGYQLTVIDQDQPAKKAVQFIPASTTKISCKDAGADHEGNWSVSVQSCYDKSMCGPSAEIASIHITTKALGGASPPRKRSIY